MAFVKIRGQQILDGTLGDNHIASNAAIAESKLNINWSSRGTEILQSKKIVDFVQVNGSAVGGLSQFDVTGAGILANTVANTTSDPLDVEGVIASGTKNVAPLRDASTGDPILANTAGDEVYGRMTFTPDDTATTTNEAKYVLKFFYFDTTLATPAEVAYTMPTGQSIDWQYAQRFNLQSVNEMFAANEKFVEGAADATAHLNIEQLARDIYGPDFSLDRDGAANLTRNLVDEIAVQTKGATNTTVRANTIIDEVVSGRGTFTSIGGRIADGENRIGALETEITNARGTDTSLDARLDAMDTKNVNQDTAITNEETARKTADELHMKETGSVGVQTGGAVTQTTTASMNLNVATAVVYNENGKRFAPAAGTVTISAADATNPRIDIVVVDSAGALAVVAGTPATSPVAPATPSGAVKLADVSVPAGDTAIESAQITDKRVYIATDKEVQVARGTYSNLDARLDALESGGGSTGTEVETARTSDITGAHTSLDLRIEAGEARYEGVKTEVEAVRSRDAASANAYFALTTFTDVEGRIKDIETVVDSKAKITDDLNTEVTNARTGQDTAGAAFTFTTLDARLDSVDTRIGNEETNRANADTAIRNDFASTAAGKGASLVGIEDLAAVFTATTVEGALKELNDDVVKATQDAVAIHKYTFQATGGETVVSLPTGRYFVAGNDSLDIYVNGTLQSVSLHYTEVTNASGEGTGVDFSPEALVAGDVVTFKYHKKSSLGN